MSDAERHGAARPGPESETPTPPPVDQDRRTGGSDATGYEPGVYVPADREPAVPDRSPGHDRTVSPGAAAYGTGRERTGDGAAERGGADPAFGREPSGGVPDRDRGGSDPALDPTPGGVGPESDRGGAEPAFAPEPSGVDPDADRDHVGYDPALDRDVAGPDGGHYDPAADHEPAIGREAVTYEGAPGGEPIGREPGSADREPGLAGAERRSLEDASTEAAVEYRDSDTADRGPADVEETAAVARERGSEVAHSAADEVKHVARTAREEARQLSEEAKAEVRHIADDARAQLRAQAEAQTERVTESMRRFGDQLGALADGRTEDAGPLAGYAGAAADELRRAAERVRDGGLDGVLDDTRRFARRRPALFLTAAVVAGFAAGRLLRGGKDAHDEHRGSGGTGDTSVTDEASSGAGAGLYTGPPQYERPAPGPRDEEATWR
ncbi:hypothetical protein [Glycomyces terrestris]|uniref:ATP synthase F0 subunit B n=1 Tax=Glycomyces terrestris TaxID=2493553 RepID=A0A426V4P3_9ACTN|nr:hypothetical protein [Glycomyces terrestris]RRS01801.1 hypothetical protein EIW28_03320 [Glycomyces terrestris]